MDVSVAVQGVPSEAMSALPDSTKQHDRARGALTYWRGWVLRRHAWSRDELKSEILKSIRRPEHPNIRPPG